MEQQHENARETAQERPQPPRPHVVALGLTVTVPDGTPNHEVRDLLLQAGGRAARDVESAYPAAVTQVRVTNP